MRGFTSLVMVLALVGCAEMSQRPEPSTTAVPTSSSTTTTSLAHITTTTSVLPEPAETEPDSGQDPGSETIGVSEKITITVIDPED